MGQGYSINIGGSIIDARLHAGKYPGNSTANLNNRGNAESASMFSEIASRYGLNERSPYLNENAKKDIIENRLAELIAKFRDGDFLFLSFSGHGGIEDSRSFMFLNDDRWEMKDLISLIKSITVKMKIFVILDCCYSRGAVGDEENLTTELIQTSIIDEFDGLKFTENDSIPQILIMGASETPIALGTDNMKSRFSSLFQLIVNSSSIKDKTYIKINNFMRFILQHSIPFLKGIPGDSFQAEDIFQF